MSNQAISYWNQNASTWDEAMAKGSPFQKTLVEPKTLEFLNVHPGMSVLDIACGNGQMSRRLASLGALVTSIDGSETMIRLAQQRSKGLEINYHIGDVTQPTPLSFLKNAQFEAVLCNMALMDICDITPVFQFIYEVLKDEGIFVFSITHPCFDKAVGPHLTELHENGGTLLTKHFIKVNQYLTPSKITTRALPSLPSSHDFFHRPLETYLKAAFETGFVMCGVAEPSFPSNSDLVEHKGWHNLSDIPVVFIAKLKK